MPGMCIRILGPVPVLDLLPVRSVLFFFCVCVLFQSPILPHLCRSCSCGCTRLLLQGGDWHFVLPLAALFRQPSFWAPDPEALPAAMCDMGGWDGRAGRGGGCRGGDGMAGWMMPRFLEVPGLGRDSPSPLARSGKGLHREISRNSERERWAPMGMPCFGTARLRDSFSFIRRCRFGFWMGPVGMPSARCWIPAFRYAPHLRHQCVPPCGSY